MIGPPKSRNLTQTGISAGSAASAIPISQVQRGLVIALTAGGVQVSVEGRLLHLLGAPSLALGTSVMLERPPSGSPDAALLRVASGPPVAVRITVETSPATLSARPSPPIAAMLVTASGGSAAVDVAVGPALAAAPPPKPALAAFLRGEPVTGVPDVTAALTLDDAVLQLPLQPRELPTSTPLTIRLLSLPSSIAAGTSENLDLPRLPADATLAVRLEPLVGAAISASTASTVPLALLGLSGAAAVISFAIEPDVRSDDGAAVDQPKVLALEVDYPKLGRVRVVVRTSSGRIDLTLRSERTLAPAVRGEIDQMMEAVAVAAGMRTSTGFAALSGGAG